MYCDVVVFGITEYDTVAFSHIHIFLFFEFADYVINCPIRERCVVRFTIRPVPLALLVHAVELIPGELPFLVINNT